MRFVALMDALLWLDVEDDEADEARAVIECIWARHLVSFGMLSLVDDDGKSKRGASEDEDEEEDEVVDEWMMLNLKPLSMRFLWRLFFF